jgi:hypothetical protein
MLTLDMRSFRAVLLQSRWPVLLALALFLGGTNYCVAVAIAGPGARLACGMNASGSSEVPACHMAMASKTGAVPPCHAARSAPVKKAATGPMPCCITLAPSASVPEAKPAMDVAVTLPPAIAVAAVPVTPWREAPLELDTGPPAAHSAAPLSSRAPPLA